jgi:hypothetical protein
VDIQIETFEQMNDTVSAVREQNVDVAFIEELVAWLTDKSGQSNA